MALVFLDETTGPVAVMPLSVEQYHSMREAGILDEDEPVELIDGLLVYKDRGGAVPAAEDPSIAEKCCYRIVRILHKSDTIVLHLPTGKTLEVPVTDWLPGTEA